MNSPKNVLFIGAGASYGARVGVPGLEAPPLGNGLLTFLRDNIDALCNRIPYTKFGACQFTINSAADSLKKHLEQESFERFLPLLDTDTRAYLHGAIQLAFSDLQPHFPNDLGFKRGRDRYDLLIDSKRISPEEWIVISLNYDLLFEDALTRRGTPFHYPEFPFGQGYPEPKDSVPIYKPHGSINFFAQPDLSFRAGSPVTEVGNATTFYEDRSGNYRPHYATRYAGMDGPENVVGRIGMPNINAVIANYTAGKDVDVNQPSLMEIRKRAIAAANVASHLLMIGVNPILDRTDDPFCAELLSLEFISVDYVCAEQRMADMVKHRFPFARLYIDGFEGYLASLREQ